MPTTLLRTQTITLHDFCHIHVPLTHFKFLKYFSILQEFQHVKQSSKTMWEFPVNGPTWKELKGHHSGPHNKKKGGRKINHSS